MVKNTVLAGKHSLFNVGLKCLLTNNKDFFLNLKGIVENSERLPTFLNTTKIDLLLMDCDTFDYTIIKFITEQSRLKVICFSHQNDSQLAQHIIDQGGHAFLNKRCDLQGLHKAVESVFADKEYIDMGFTDIEALTFKTTRFSSIKFYEKHKLTRREKEVLLLIARAMSNQQIAEQLFISDQTVSVHRKNIMRKLGVNSTASVIKIAYENSIV